MRVDTYMYLHVYSYVYGHVHTWYYRWWVADRQGVDKQRSIGHRWWCRYPHFLSPALPLGLGPALAPIRATILMKLGGPGSRLVELGQQGGLSIREWWHLFQNSCLGRKWVRRNTEGGREGGREREREREAEGTGWDGRDERGGKQRGRERGKGSTEV